MGDTDILGAPYTAETIRLPGDDEGPVEATLVHRQAYGFPSRGDAAVLHLHGFADYFFQTGYADLWTARGHDFYALDLRKYGRSLRPHQTPNYVTDVHDYFAEIDEAWRRITERDGHDRVILSAHSTGGLTLPLWLHHRRPEGVDAMVLNAPWFDLRGSTLLRTLGTRVIDLVGARQPRRVIPREVNGLYARSLHHEHDGEWDFRLDWKPLNSWPVTFGWLRAIRRGHAELHRGLDVRVPTLVLTSDATSAPEEMGEAVHVTDVVLDVTHMWRWAPALGSRHLTVAVIDGARHDVVLSRQPAREAAYDTIERWLAGLHT